MVDDTRIDGIRNATITAHVANWTDGTASIAVEDNENNNLTLTLPPRLTEGGTGTGTVAVSGTLASALTVTLASANTARLTVPATVTIPAGSASATFTLTAPNNSLAEGTQPVALTASASGFIAAGGTTNVLDNDVHHYAVAAIASPQVAGVPFSVTLTAKDLNDVTIASYTGTPGLSANGSGGPVPVIPTVTTAFASGVWTGNVTVHPLSNQGGAHGQRRCRPQRNQQCFQRGGGCAASFRVGSGGEPAKREQRVQHDRYSAGFQQQHSDGFCRAGHAQWLGGGIAQHRNRHVRQYLPAA